jgi:hypothetical protein
VEHSAIEVAPPHARPTFDELVLLRIDDVDRQSSGQDLEPFVAHAADMDLEMSAGEPHSDGLRKALVRDLADDSELSGPVAKEIPDVPRSKGSAAAKEVDRF